MQRCEVTLLEVRLENGGWRSGRIECPADLRPAPGQYLLAHAPGRDEVLPSSLFGARGLPLLADGTPAPGELELAPPLPAGWTAGTHLAVRGPLGHGFNLPASARRVGLVGLRATPHRLLSLADLALTQGAAVTLYTRSVPDRLPPEVEVLPLESLSEALTWADFLAFDLAPAALPGLKRRFGLAPHTFMPVPSQVLVDVPMPCGGIAECGLCAVQARRGYRLACKEGPVFDLNELEEV
jgi:dihydroorotate dehydrogenase electron transfer subunit